MGKVLEYEELLDKRLKPELVRVTEMRDKSMEELKTYDGSSDLESNIKMLEENNLAKLRSLVNLGSEIYCQAQVEDTSRIFVDIGLGFYAEFTWSEALNFIPSKKKALQKCAEEQTQQIAKIKAQIKLVCEGIREIQKL